MTRKIAFVLLAVTFTLFMATVVVLADMRSLGFLHVMYSFPNGDKASHLLLYGTLTLLVDLALFHLLPRRDPVSLTVMAGSIIAVIVSVEEVSQLLFSSRNADWKDLLASCLGIVSFSIAALAAYNLFPPEETAAKRDVLASERN